MEKKYVCTFRFHASGEGYYKKRFSHFTVSVPEGAGDDEIMAAFDKRFDELFPPRWNESCKYMQHYDPDSPNIEIDLDDVDWAPAIENPTSEQLIDFYDRKLKEQKIVRKENRMLQQKRTD